MQTLAYETPAVFFSTYAKIPPAFKVIVIFIRTNQIKGEAMIYPYCRRCQTKNNHGKKTCGSCRVTIAVARELNNAINFCKGNKKQVARFLGFQNRSSFYRLSQAIPEVHEAWEAIEGKPQDEAKKILGTRVMDKVTLTEFRMWKKLLRFYDYQIMEDEKQRQFVDWFHSNSSRITLAEAKGKIVEIDSDVIRI
ncbi:hypothetical protein OAT67_01830 [Bacteriovoracaceae bacterium]|nr:hypothetical protein [Bacteriovoracaceae bacterium]